MIKLIDFALFCFENKTKVIKVKDAYGMKIVNLYPCNRQHLEQEYGNDLMGAEVLRSSFMDGTVFTEINIQVDMIELEDCE